MKKLAIVLYIFLLAIGVFVNVYGQQTEAGENAQVMIPDQAIRLRILANSDSDEDQALKRKVRDAVNEQINGWVAHLTSFSQAEQVIRLHLPDIEKTVADVLKKEKSDQTYHVQFGKVHFPTKIYGNYIYPAGEYQAILITLGEGKGANWWCVLFPPLCFLDFSNGEAVKAEEGAKTEVTPASEEAHKSEEHMNKKVVNKQQPEKDNATFVKKEKTTKDHEQEETENSPALQAAGAGTAVMSSSDVVVNDDDDKVEVKFFIKEMIGKIWP
ncbi:stage II sporulation protein R [Anoxybacillus sp. B7M1]|uniref:stage II sporulation protein R n=1 Tax=unclassified Anoxybacillus TaxID=2639704 RepID=UPI0005CD1B39|nr:MULTISPECIES: stage II sporulation protein R [unclassified Anoxybacillus]ANB55850.1 stage II sporulation protein R [Anoxybacillus sp. B2M1]ANB63318.1 stage II sporulation protein R [Anoxybacillus sp. B7M1]